MSSGGARRNSGKRPDPNSLRQYSNSEWVTLPPPRTGPAPEWPFRYASDRELEVWREWWGTSQAAMWERQGSTYEVAAAVRCLMSIEDGTAKANDHAQFRQYLDSLGLTVKGMRANFWKLPESSTDAAIHPIQEGAQTTRSNRDRFRVVSSDG